MTDGVKPEVKNEGESAESIQDDQGATLNEDHQDSQANHNGDQDGEKPESESKEGKDTQDTAELNWRDRMAADVPEENRRKFRKSLDNYASEADVGRDLLNMRKGLDNKADLPTDDASDEELDNFWGRMGWPEHEDGKTYSEAYEYTSPEWLDDTPGADVIKEAQEAFFTHQHEQRIPSNIANGNLDFFYKIVEEDNARRDEFSAESEKKMMSELKDEYGAEREANLEQSNIYLNNFGDAEELWNLRLEDGRRVGQVTELRKAIISAARRSGEPGLQGDFMSPETKANLQEQIDTIKAKAEKDGNYWTDPVQKKIRKLYEELHGTEPADGRV